MELLLAVEDLPAAVRDPILERTHGNPFFLEEVVHSLIDAGKLYRNGPDTRGERGAPVDCAFGAWRARAGIETVKVPESVQSATPQPRGTGCSQT